MDGLCAYGAEDDEIMFQKIRIFASDRSIDTITGIRRMGRDNLVKTFLSICYKDGIPASMYPDIPTQGILVFTNWLDSMEEIERIGHENPDIDIVYGQDLCHQVPAIVRYRK